MIERFNGVGGIGESTCGMLAPTSQPLDPADLHKVLRDVKRLWH